MSDMMTKEEAIKHLEEWKEIISNGRRKQAIDMAIEALQAKTDGDLISRQDAIESLGEEPEIWNDTEEEWAYRNAWVEHISALKALPSAEPKTGEWIEVEVLPEVYDIEGVKTWGSKMQCDQCGFRFTAIEGHIRQYNFCPYCGSFNGVRKNDKGRSNTSAERNKCNTKVME